MDADFLGAAAISHSRTGPHGRPSAALLPAPSGAPVHSTRLRSARRSPLARAGAARELRSADGIVVERGASLMNGFLCLSS